jgi:DNA sulfur modification protein DndD
MRLISLRLENFRQFYGKTPELLLSGDRGRNITVFHGNNGAGKTSVLNAFTWILYRKFTAAFAEPEQLINRRALAEIIVGKSVDCWGELVWELEEKRYRAKRSIRATLSKDGRLHIGEELLTLHIAGIDGQWYISPQPPMEVIGQILPVSLHQYFFFDGERIEQIVRQDRRTEIAEAMKILIGVEVLNRAIGHLGEAKKVLLGELKQLGAPQSKELLQKRQQYVDRLEAMRERDGEIGIEIDRLNGIKQSIQQQLLVTTATQSIELQRQTIERQKEGSIEQLHRQQAALKDLISTRGYTFLIGSAIGELNTIVSGSRDRGELHLGVSREFVKSLLASQICLCGTPLPPDSNAYSHACQWLSRAGFAAIDDVLSRLSARAGEIDRQTPELKQNIQREVENINTSKKAIETGDRELSKILEQLRESTDEDARNLQAEFDTIELSLRDLILERGANQQKSQQGEGELQRIDRQLERQQQVETKASIAQRRIAATNEAIECLQAIRHRQEELFRHQLQEKVREIFSQVSFSGYIPQVTEKYELILTDKEGNSQPIPASTGENQLLSLSFIGAIIERVRQWSREKVLAVPDSSSFPIVMDSPFGSLDRHARRQVATILPQLADRLAILVTPTQWRGEVAAAISPRVGKQYIFVYHSSRKDTANEQIQLNGKFYPLVLPSDNEFDYTECVVVDDREEAIVNK